MMHFIYFVMINTGYVQLYVYDIAQLALMYLLLYILLLYNVLLAGARCHAYLHAWCREAIFTNANSA
jgi:hypothetical protein